MEPSYHVVFGDDDTLDLYTDRGKMQGACRSLFEGACVSPHRAHPTRASPAIKTDSKHPVNTASSLNTDAIERLEPGAFPQYAAYLDAAQANLEFGFPAFIEERLPPLQALPPFLHNVLHVFLNLFVKESARPRSIP